VTSDIEYDWSVVMSGLGEGPAAWDKDFNAGHRFNFPFHEGI
jgi:hypothetical protein